jgi:hypothetical protein
MTCIDLFNVIQEEMAHTLIIINFQNILNILGVIITSIIINMVKLFPLSILYLGLSISLKKYNKLGLEKIDFKNNIYYREILPKYSPAVLSFLDNFVVSKKDVVATLLMLEMKGKIEIGIEEIIVKDETTDNLEENEQYILKKVKKRELKQIDVLEYENIVKKDALNLGLVEEVKKIKQKFKQTIACFVIFLCIVTKLKPKAKNQMQNIKSNLVTVYSLQYNGFNISFFHQFTHHLNNHFLAGYI